MTRNTEATTEMRNPVTMPATLLQRMQAQHMSESERQAAAEWLRDGESLADAICRAADSLRSTAAFLQHHFARSGR
jgi:capsid protein